MTRYRRVDPDLTRRKIVNWALGATAGISGLSFITIVGSAKPVNRETPETLPPADGDLIVHGEGDKLGQPVKISELEPQPLRCYPQGKDKDGKTFIKKGENNTNLLLISKFPAGQITAPTDLQATVQGSVVAYSAICQHLGCPVGWKNENQTYLCPCHSGNYDPKQGCKVIGGPPPRPLPQLPLRAQGDQLIVAGTYLTPPYGISESDFDKYKEKAEKEKA